jgi:hypothetical protein
MVKVRISATIADEYMTRDMYEFIGKAGTYTLTLEQAQELRDDAIHNALDVDYMPPGTARAYSALASKLIEAIGQ